MPAARPAALRQPTPRFVAALCISALTHISIPLVVSGGGSRSSSKADESPLTLSVRVLPRQVQVEAQPVDPPRLTEEPAPPAARPQPVEPEPRIAAPEPNAHVKSGGAGLPDAPDLTYYPAKQLDVYPKLLSTLDLNYRGKAADEGLTGRALLLVLIDEVGAVKDVSVVEAEPANAFEDDAQRAFLAARFAPAYRNGRAVRSRVLIAVNYGVERGSP